MEKQETKQLKKLLKQKLSEKEKQELKNAGFDFKAPTRQTLILVALYKKAAAGDMNAIKEIRALCSDKRTVESGVEIIDNIPSSNG